MIRANCDLETPEGKSRYLTEGVKYLATLKNPVEREVYAGELAKETGILRDTILTNLDQAVKQNYRKEKKKEWKDIETQKELYGDRVNPQRAANFGASKAEEGILAYLFRNPDHLGRILSEVDEDAFVTDFNRQLFRIMKEKLQTNNGVSLSDFAEELSPEQMARLTAIVNQETPNSETALSDYVRALSEYKMRDESRHAGELSVEELQNVAERIRQQKKK